MNKKVILKVFTSVLVGFMYIHAWYSCVIIRSFKGVYIRAFSEKISDPHNEYYFKNTIKIFNDPETVLHAGCSKELYQPLASGISQTVFIRYAIIYVKYIITKLLPREGPIERSTGGQYK